jgi:DNA helicase-2/ATP-dependent DNA helicase PcrA
MPELADILARSLDRGYVVAPAGYGKTHLIADAVSRAGTRQLVLTHTYAGLNALRRKMRERRVPDRACRVDTIASWALRLCLSYRAASGWSIERPHGNQWALLYDTCARFLQQGFVRRILSASYGGVYVDEYQDCSPAQHRLVLALAHDLPCRVLGDPLQAVFDFDAEPPVDWDTAIVGAFENLGQLDTPQRWIRAGQPALGEWLRRVRLALESQQPVDLTEGRPPSIHYRPALSEADLLRVQGNACRYFECERHERVIAIHKGSPEYKAKCHRLARMAGGKFSSIEEIEGRELFSFVDQIERAKTHRARLKKVIEFAKRCMTAVEGELTAATLRGEIAPIRNNTRNPLLAAAANAYLAAASSAAMAAFLDALRKRPDVAVVRADLFFRMAGVLHKHVLHPDLTLDQAADKYHTEFRHNGRPVGRRRLIGTTLLVKGLEFDHAIVLDAASLSRKELYVALTRGARSLTLVSSQSSLNPPD